MARILAVFNIVKAKDTAGNVIEPELKFVTGVSRYAYLATSVRNCKLSVTLLATLHHFHMIYNHGLQRRWSSSIWHSS